jgi:hypothetical protein
MTTTPVARELNWRAGGSEGHGETAVPLKSKNATDLTGLHGFL